MKNFVKISNESMIAVKGGGAGSEKIIDGSVIGLVKPISVLPQFGKLIKMPDYVIVSAKG